MFGRISFKSQPEKFQLVLGFSHGGRRSPGDTPQRKVTVEWTSADSDSVVLDRISAAISDPSLVEESVRALLAAPQDPGAGYGVVAASAFYKQVQLSLEIHSTKPTLDAVELLRISGSGSMPSALASSVWSALELSYVKRVRCSVGTAGLLEQEALARLSSLRVLNLSHCEMTALPGMVGLLQGLEELRLVGNRLKMLPPELGLLRNLRILAADSNEIIILPGELRHCSRLEEVTLEHNRLTSVLLSFRAFPHLQVLHLFNNPLEFLPEISPCQSLRHLSVANLRVTADPGYTKFNVELLPASVLSSGGGGGMGISLFDSSKKEDKLRPIFALMLRRSSGHHPLLAGALRQVAEQDAKNRDLMARQENALQQLVLMALNDNPIVVEQTCITLRLLAQHSPTLAETMVDSDLDSVMMLLSSDQERIQLACLQVLAAVAFESQVAAVEVLTDQVLSGLELLVAGNYPAQPEDQPPSPQLRAAALEAVGNLAFAPKNRTRLQGRQGLMQQVLTLAQQESGALGPGGQRVKAAAVRVLAVLGENDAVWRAVRRRPLVSERGVRILSMDGGGMKGMATVQLLRELEARTGRRIPDMFDLICGTSTGGLLAVALGLRGLSLDDCERIYKVLGQKVFSRPLAKQDKEETWMESFYRTFHSKTQHVRAVVVGYKHDAAIYETLLKEYCDFGKEPQCLADSMIDTACLDAPKVALVSTMASCAPAAPFIFRNYELPQAREALFRQIQAHGGSSKHKVWQAVRASSAATYYLDDFTCGADRFQDGAVVANNPAIIALQEARLLWPDAPIDVVVSLGSGSATTQQRGAAVSSFMETGSILIESACGVDRPAEALATLLPLVPGVKYYRFTPVDQRCAMELDEIDPAKWALLEDATREYIHSMAHKFDDVAAALSKDLEEAESTPVPPTPKDTLTHLRLGPRRQLTLIDSACPAAGTPAQQAAALAGIFDTVVDVQRRETRGRLARPAGSVLRASTLTPAMSGSSSFAAAAQRLSAAAAESKGSESGSGAAEAAGAAGGALTSSPGQAVAATLAAGAAGLSAAGLAPPVAPVAAAAGVLAEEGGTGGAGAQPVDGEDGQGGGLSTLLSWFSPRKPTYIALPLAASSAGGPGDSAAQNPLADAIQALGDSMPPQREAMGRSAAKPPQAGGARNSHVQHSRSGGSTNDGKPASAGPEQQPFLTFRLGKQSEAQLRGSAEALTGSTGLSGAASPAATAVSNPRHAGPAVVSPGLAAVLGPAGRQGTGVAAASAEGEASAAVPANGHQAPQSRPSPSSLAALSAPAQATHGDAADLLTTAAAAAEAPAADPAAFLAQELGCVLDCDAVELGACHLALAPSGEGLVLSWRQDVQAVLEPSDTSAALLRALGREPSTITLAELFDGQPLIPLPIPNGSAAADGTSSNAAAQGSSCSGGVLGMLSRQVQWIAGRQLSVLLLQSTLLDELLTHDKLEGELRGALDQQIAVCPHPLPHSLLLGLLGGAGAVAVVCPREATLPANGSGTSQSAGLPVGTPLVHGTPQRSSSGGAGGGGAATADEEAASAFFQAFYAALKGGAFITAALAVAESAQPGLAGVFGVHGMRDGALVVLPD